MSRNLEVLHPRLQQRFALLTELCAAKGLIIKNTSTMRTAAEQKEAYDNKATSLLYPHSHHNWGTAVDFCRNDGKGAYNNEGNFFERVGAIAESIGLIWGGHFSHPDRPHLQLADWGKTADILIAVYGTPDKFRATWEQSDQGKPEPPREPVEDGFAIRDKVIVTGTIYGTGNGKGGTIRKNRAVMYIVDYAGANYPHCYGVAKSPNGTRQGWASPKILQLADASVEYMKWPAICNESNTNVRTGPGTGHSTLAACPLLSVGNEVDVIGEGMAANGRMWYQVLIANEHIGWVYGGFLNRA